MNRMSRLLLGMSLVLGPVGSAGADPLVESPRATGIRQAVSHLESFVETGGDSPYAKYFDFDFTQISLSFSQYEHIKRQLIAAGAPSSADLSDENSATRFYRHRLNQVVQDLIKIDDKRILKKGITKDILDFVLAAKLGQKVGEVGPKFGEIWLDERLAHAEYLATTDKEKAEALSAQENVRRQAEGQFDRAFDASKFKNASDRESLAEEFQRFREFSLGRSENVCLAFRTNDQARALGTKARHASGDGKTLLTEPVAKEEILASFQEYLKTCSPYLNEAFASVYRGSVPDRAPAIVQNTAERVQYLPTAGR